MTQSLGSRMKEYEEVWNTRLPRRLPVVIRVDGNSFSKKTKQWNLRKPYDTRMMTAMEKACKAICEYCSGMVAAYTHSDEASFILVNDQSIFTEPFLGGRIQKINSLVASTFTSKFNDVLSREVWGKKFSPAVFDSRVLVLPKEEVVNYLIWRQNECWRNAVSATTYYDIADKIGSKKKARKMMHGLNSKQQQELLFQTTGINMNDELPAWKRGLLIKKSTYQKNTPDGPVTRSEWKSQAAPKFTEDREFIWEGIYDK